jgi:hypothetical protein
LKQRGDIASLLRGKLEKPILFGNSLKNADLHLHQIINNLKLLLKTESFLHNFKGVAETNLRYSSETPTFYQNDLAMRNTADVTDKPIAV